MIARARVDPDRGPGGGRAARPGDRASIELRDAHGTRAVDADPVSRHAARRAGAVTAATVLLDDHADRDRRSGDRRARRGARPRRRAHRHAVRGGRSPRRPRLHRRRRRPGDRPRVHRVQPRALPGVLRDARRARDRDPADHDGVLGVDPRRRAGGDALEWGSGGPRRGVRRSPPARRSPPLAVPRRDPRVRAPARAAIWHPAPPRTPRSTPTCWIGAPAPSCAIGSSCRSRRRCGRSRRIAAARFPPRRSSGSSISTACCGRSGRWRGARSSAAAGGTSTR